MGGACSTYGEEQKCRNLRERDHLEDPGVDGRIILQWIFRKWNMKAWTGSSWLRDRWRTLVSEVMNIRVP